VLARGAGAEGQRPGAPGVGIVVTREPLATRCRFFFSTFQKNSPPWNSHFPDASHFTIRG